MTHARNTGPMIAAAKARSEDALKRSRKALRDLTKTGEPITFKAVAKRAGVSSRYLSSHPELGPKIRSLSIRSKSMSAKREITPSEESGVIAALRKQMRKQRANHEQEVRNLKSRIRELEDQVATLTGQAISTKRCSDSSPVRGRPTREN